MMRFGNFTARRVRDKGEQPAPVGKVRSARWGGAVYSSFRIRQRLVREMPRSSAAFDLLPPSISITFSA